VENEFYQLVWKNMKNNYGFCFDNTYLNLPSSFYTHCFPETARSPEIAILNRGLATSIGLDFASLSDKELAELLSGSKRLENGGYYAQAYAGHQYGHFTILGDGRAVILGEHVTPDHKRVDIQLKGSGRTRYSRSGDGKAVLGPMLREYIISEAMHNLGVPTTRSLGVVKTGETVWREEKLPGAILIRVASSHLRIGTFEFAALKENTDDLKLLLDYAIARHYPDLAEAENKAIALLRVVIERQVDLIVDWMRVGFIHGVMNTDNITISGETIDYGPCAFMDDFSYDRVFSSIDDMGRYAYGQQPSVAFWNLSKFADVLLPLVDSNPRKATDMIEEALNLFPTLYQKKWLIMMKKKLGLFDEHDLDQVLINDLLNWMQAHNSDFTNTFYDLGKEGLPIHLHYQEKAFTGWYQRWQVRLSNQVQSKDQAIELMMSVNPSIIPRNHQVEYALQAANLNDFEPLFSLLEALKTPYKAGDSCNDCYRLAPTPEQKIFHTFCGT